MKNVFKSFEFIVLSLICVYTLILSQSLVFYTDNYLINSTSSGQQFVVSPEEHKELQFEFLEFSLMAMKAGIVDTRGQLYKILNQQKSYENENDTIPDFVIREQATLDEKLKDFDKTIPEVKKS